MGEYVLEEPLDVRKLRKRSVKVGEMLDAVKERFPPAVLARGLAAFPSVTFMELHLASGIYDDDGAADVRSIEEAICIATGGHHFERTGTAYGGDDESYGGEGRSLCANCGADGDA